jgi:hypothetical protein
MDAAKPSIRAAAENNKPSIRAAAENKMTVPAWGGNVRTFPLLAPEGLWHAS